MMRAIPTIIVLAMLAYLAAVVFIPTIQYALKPAHFGPVFGAQ
jgi:hypothetical protein